MARVSGGVIGYFQGKLGLLSARKVNGRTIMSARPAGYKESTTPKHAEVKQQFAVTVAFASAISNLPALYEIWNLKKKPGLSVNNSIFKSNYDSSSPQAPTLNNIIVPGGYKSPVTSVVVAADKLTGSLLAMNKVAVISNTDVNLSINAIISLSDPKEEGDPFYKVISVSKEIAGFEFTQAYNFEIDFDVVEADEISKYNQKLVFISVATKSADNAVNQYTRSQAIQSV
jgi:hypothetical protein